MSGFAKLFLVLLRLAIGWHLLFEGVVKVRTHELGKTTAGTPFTSAPYLRESAGPFSDFFRKQVGDPDEEALARLELRELKLGEDSSRSPAKTRIPLALEDAWDAYFDRWAEYYGVKDDPQQLCLAECVLAQAKEQAGLWLQGRVGEKETSKGFGGVVAKLKMKPPERIADYRQKLGKVREMQDEALPEFQRD